MSGIEMYRSSNAVRGLSRPLVRVLSQIDTQAGVRVARVDAQAEVQAAKVDAAGLVTQRAMQSVAIVSQLEQQLGQLVPLAVTRLQAVGDLATLAMGEIVADTVFKLRRQ